jgi:GT2 family glycosyltransferase
LESDPPFPISTGSFSFIRTDEFRRLGMYDETTFMYSEEFDLCWRILLSGGKIIRVPTARIHHRGEVAVNPAGGTKRVEFRTSERKRFYANRNHLLMLLKYPQHILFAMFCANVALQFVEAIFWLVTQRRWSLVRESFFRPLAECWRLRGHVATKRREMRAFRRHGDFWMLRHLSCRFGRWPEVRRIMKLGLPKV